MDISTEGQFRRHEMMIATVTGEESYGCSLQRSHNQRIRGRTKRRINYKFFYILEGFHFVKPTTANNANLCFSHRPCLLLRCNAKLFYRQSDGNQQKVS